MALGIRKGFLMRKRFYVFHRARYRTVPRARLLAAMFSRCGLGRFASVCSAVNAARRHFLVPCPVIIQARKSPIPKRICFAKQMVHGPSVAQAVAPTVEACQNFRTVTSLQWLASERNTAATAGELVTEEPMRRACNGVVTPYIIARILKKTPLRRVFHGLKSIARFMGRIGGDDLA
ncbi:hypothetical protein JDN40_10915 [Rhodomicrobium vannielii ATCC 17100]|uniref:hypothetical protein n=1 Tax=Rhodomicrobium vannielii TaxID=1069 RepID=UPI00191AAB3C|nr:hypothetical protein [Rhodomicrobium vannielii]MBJ7534615.1 hypothetical protein [Rhodomicrobium vannielii ATCC 17100]